MSFWSQNGLAVLELCSYESLMSALSDRRLVPGIVDPVMERAAVAEIELIMIKLESCYMSSR